jgi:uncharacterized protein (TIGR03067 family)
MEAILCFMFISVGTDNPTLAKEMDRLDGAWHVVAAEEKGQKIPANKLPIEKIVFARKAPVKSPAGCQAMTYSIDLAKSPKTISATEATDRAKKMTFAGIYQIDDDKLKLCLVPGGKDIPAEFATKPDKDMILLELKRVKK